MARGRKIPSLHTCACWPVQSVMGVRLGEAGWGLELCLAVLRAKSWGCSISAGNYLDKAVSPFIYGLALHQTLETTGPGASHGQRHGQLPLGAQRPPSAVWGPLPKLCCEHTGSICPSCS